MLLPVGPGGPVDRPDRALIVGPPAATGSGPDVVLVAAGEPHADAPSLLVLDDPADAAGAPCLLVIAPEDAADAMQAADAAADPSTVVLDLGLDRSLDAADASVRFDASAELAAAGHPVAVAVDTPLGSPVAVVTAAVAAGIRLLRVGAGTDVREVRRAADVTEALLLERRHAAGEEVVLR